MGLVVSLLPILSLIAAAGFFLLFLLARRRSRRDPARTIGPVADGAAMALAALPLGPLPVLEPAAIFRQILWDPAEVAPVWVRPQPEPVPDVVEAAAGLTEGATTAASQPARRTRRAKAEGTKARKPRKSGGAKPPA